MIKNFTHKAERVQLLLVALVWLLLFAIPVLFGNSEENIEWPHIFKIWEEYSVVLIIFVLNRFVLMPYLFLKEKRIAYFISVVGIITLFSTILFILQYTERPIHPEDFQLPPADGRPQGFGTPMQNGPSEFIPPIANLIIISILLVGFDSGLMFFSKWMVSEQNKLKAERESIANKMAFLQNQISPHFFMNTLNNIHALIDIDREKAKDAIIKLSQMMDYMLYESKSQRISLKQEMDFTRSYVNLMRLRITDEVDLKLQIPDTLPQIQIPPLLSISFIENAFKYGISYQSPSFIHICVNVSNGQFVFKVENSIHQKIKQDKNTGIGIENTRKRLELLFGNNYTLKINNEDGIFKVNLAIPIC
jgi:Putative regulator of cell autolysis